MIRIGVIGCGIMAGAFSPAFAAMKNDIVPTAMIDIAPDRAQAAVEKFPTARAFTDYREAFPHADAFIIALPHDLHFQVASDCLKAGKHVLLEKPMCNTEAECLDLIRLHDQSSRVLSIGYVMRYDPLWTQMGEFIRAGNAGPAGDIFQVSIWTEQLTLASRAWGGSVKRIGGGQLFSHGCHYIDLLLHWLGRPVRGSHVGSNRGTPGMEMEGTSNVAIEFENGRLGYHFGTWGARGTRLRYSVHAHGEKGMLELDYAKSRISLLRDPHGGDLPALQASLPPGAKLESPSEAILATQPEAIKHTTAEIAAFVHCIKTGELPVTNPRTALQSLRVVWRLYDAERRNIVADLRGLGLDEVSLEPDPILRASGFRFASL